MSVFDIKAFFLLTNVYKDEALREKNHLSEEIWFYVFKPFSCVTEIIFFNTLLLVYSKKKEKKTWQVHFKSILNPLLSVDNNFLIRMMFFYVFFRLLLWGKIGSRRKWD